MPEVGPRAQLFIAARHAFKLHPEWTDEQVLEYLHIRIAGPDETDILAQARLDASGGYQGPNMD